ncbi:type I-F CRISPR-associated endoribonuclease Cas6/Csy4 [Pseudomonas putida]|nr:type I-F CRISPR-associated endoribonuclease Cas6/Csy4 [Pseudomonas putida]
MNRYYVDLRLLDQKNLGVKMKTHIYSDLQRILAMESISDVAIGFPRYGELNPYAEPTLGETFRLVSASADRLAFILEQPAIKAVVAAGVLKASKVSLVPDDAKEVRFVRNQKPTRLKRQAVALDAGLKDPRCEQFRGESSSILIKRLDGSVYPIFIDRHDSEVRHEGSYSSFGLSGKAGATFPHF